MTDKSAEEFFYDDVKTIFDNCDWSVLLSEKKYKSLVKEVQLAQNALKNRESLTSKDYRRLKRYDIMIMNEKEKLMKKRSTDSPPIYYCSFSELYDALKKAHIDVGNKRTRVIDVFLSTCEQCELKKKMPKKGLVVHNKFTSNDAGTISAISPAKGTLVADNRKSPRLLDARCKFIEL